MPLAVVEGLEPVDVEERQRERLTDAIGPVDLVAQRFLAETAGVDACQLVQVRPGKVDPGLAPVGRGLGAVGGGSLAIRGGRGAIRGGGRAQAGQRPLEAPVRQLCGNRQLAPLGRAVSCLCRLVARQRLEVAVAGRLIAGDRLARPLEAARDAVGGSSVRASSP